jgi:hypothetical protein
MEFLLNHRIGDNMSIDVRQSIRSIQVLKKYIFIYILPASSYCSGLERY